MACDLSPRSEEEGIAIVAVADVRALPDGRATAAVSTADPTGAGTGSFVEFVAAGDRWLIDEIAAVVQSDATPVP